jgi:hypothetical protein
MSQRELSRLAAINGRMTTAKGLARLGAAGYLRSLDASMAVPWNTQRLRAKRYRLTVPQDRGDPIDHSAKHGVLPVQLCHR